ncbi:MAG: AAA family ATPase [Polyangiaceae bacterium]
MPARELNPDECRRRIEPSKLGFETTATVEPTTGVLSQERALHALALGLEIRQPRFHVVVVGSPGSGRTFSVRSTAEAIAARRPTPDDMLLLPNPERPSEPTAIGLPAGEGRRFVETMTALHGKLTEALHSATEGERFKQAQSRAHRKTRREEAKLEQVLIETASTLGFTVERSGDEIEIRRAGAEDEEDPPPEDLDAVKNAIDDFEAKVTEIHEEAETELRASIKQFLTDALRSHFANVIAQSDGKPGVQPFLEKLESSLTTRIHGIIDDPRDEPALLPRGFLVPTLLTEHTPGTGAPVIEVAHATLTSLFGRSHAPPDGALPPEPGFAVAGALHQSNGGFLILPAASLLKNEALYEHLKACLLSGRFIVPDQNPSYYRGAAEELLFPSMAIDVKVVLVAGPGLFQELHAADPEFMQLFKIQARFEPTLPFDEALRTYPAFLAGLARERKLLHLTSTAVSELIFLGGRLAESQSKVTSCLGMVAEVATEASYLAERKGEGVVDAWAVNAAIEGAQRRGSHFRDALHELLTNGTIRIETTGAFVGQVNAISVLSDGPVSFGRPCRVTAVVYPGQEGPLNIAREVEMSGPIHSKGVLVLTGFLASRFARTRPLSFSASLVFEQTYEAIDGDSASASELYGLLSALSSLPLRQDLAVTGSVDQRGSIQPVGGLNEKIEAFFDVCQAKGGLTGSQGVLIPVPNVDALMLRSDVVEAIAKKRFHLYTVATVEEGIELLTGVAAGVAPVGEPYPEGTVFARVEARLDRYYEVLTARRQALLAAT